MDINNILNEKEGGANGGNIKSATPNSSGWTKPESAQGLEPVRLPSLTTTGFSTYPHAPYAPRYSFETSKQNPTSLPSPQAYSPGASGGPDNAQSLMDDDPSKPYHCKTCQKGFARRSDLSRHERIHSGIRPHVCEFEGCGKQFIQRSALTVHSRVHTGEKPHMCEACGKPFSDSSSLARHRRIHSGKRPYKCPYADCQKTFTRRTTLTRHQNHHTGTISEAAAATAAALATRRSSSKSNVLPLHSPGGSPREDSMESVSQSHTGSNSSLRISQGLPLGADLDKAASPVGWRHEGQAYQTITPRPTPSSTPTIPATLVTGTASLQISDTRRGLPNLPVLGPASLPRSISPTHHGATGISHQWPSHMHHGSQTGLFHFHTPVSLSPRPVFR